ncbi:MAG: helix-turn-helix domain-containing protein [Planctomycetes bacterium]|nr:helix-turn-helix domain-containing protein [Planctomycetota bacterium]
MTVAEAALHAGVSQSLIYAWCGDKSLAHTRVGRVGKRGHIRIAIEDLDGVLAALKVTKTASVPSVTVRYAPPLRLKHVRVKP